VTGRPSGPVDLRSDTVTVPDVGMRAAMAAALVGDDVYGEDPDVNALQERVADLLGKEAALFTVTGSLANILAVRGVVAPGQEVLCESRAHIARAEMGSHAVVSGVTTRTWTHPRGLVDIEAIKALAAPGAGAFFVSTSAVSVENTHNFGGGSVQPHDQLLALRAYADEAGVALHLDGARLWNTSVASGRSMRELAAPFDVVCVCLSKGMGAPVGSLVAGPADLIDDARIWRKRLGGGWRQAGVLAAAGDYAIDHNFEQLARTHEDAKLIASVCADALPGCVDPADVETNIVVLDVSSASSGADQIIEAAASHGVRVSSTGANVLRVVTHLSVSSEQTRYAAGVLAAALAGHES
jgi:threonine aldolase